jgi:hypothetical protein
MTYIYDQPALKPEWIDLIHGGGWDGDAVAYQPTNHSDELGAALFASAAKDSTKYLIDKFGYETVVRQALLFQEWLVPNRPDKPLKVYRGHCDREMANAGISWTAERCIAAYHSHYNMQFPQNKIGNEPFVVERAAHPHEVLMMLPDDPEQEVILRR